MQHLSIRNTVNSIFSMCVCTCWYGTFFARAMIFAHVQRRDTDTCDCTCWYGTFFARAMIFAHVQRRDTDTCDCTCWYGTFFARAMIFAHVQRRGTDTCGLHVLVRDIFRSCHDFCTCAETGLGYVRLHVFPSIDCLLASARGPHTSGFKRSRKVRGKSLFHLGKVRETCNGQGKIALL